MIFTGMHDSFDIWKALAGIAIFLLGMNFMEETLHKLSGRQFKLFLKKHTSNKVKAISAGAVVTGILQSSSVVNLMVLAFVGAGVIKMQNALAIILGANLGTTISSWIIATVGFKFNIESIALAVTGIAGLAMALMNRENRWHMRSKLFLGIGLLFTGLEFIKTGIEALVQQVDLGSFAQYPVILFILVGILITSLIQSSSATVAIVLSALHVQAISLYAATAIVLGSEIGTSLKLVLASINGQAVKKRVAAGNILFNLVTTLIVFLFLRQVNQFITGTIGIQDNLSALVFFQSLVNLAGIILFFPFLDIFGRFLEKRFVNAGSDTLFIHKVNVADTDLAMEALEKETRQFIIYVSHLVLSAFDRPTPNLTNLAVNKDFRAKQTMAKYEYIKQIHGKMNEYCIQLRSNLTKQDTIRLEQLIAATRNAMYTAKSLKDACPDIEQLRNSSNNVKFGYYRSAGDAVADFYKRLLTFLLAKKNQSLSDALAGFYESIQENYRESLQKLYKEAGTRQLSEIEFSTIMNFNREMYTSFKSAIFAAKDYLLDSEKAEYFDDLPGFIR